MSITKVAIYTRVSTDGQAEVEFNSCEAQEAKIKAFISSQDSMDIYNVYSDQGYSGADIDRPALTELMRDIQLGKINAVISYKIDRLTRSPRDFYQLIEVFEQFNVSFISVTERFDTSTPSGRLLRNIMLTFAQFERELISERIRDKMFERAKKGLWNCGYAPYGYKRENKKLVPEPQEASIVKKIYELFHSRGSTADVYHQLKSEGITCRKGKLFDLTGISHILKNVVYIGKVPYHGQIYQGEHAPIITEELFNSVQGLHKGKVKNSKVYNYSLFTGLVRCKECGSTMTFSFTNKNSKGPKVRYFYYRCSSISKRDRSFCGIRHVSMDRLDKFVIENLTRISADPYYLEGLMLKHKNEGQPVLKRVEMRGVTSPGTSKNVKSSMEKIIEAAKLKDLTERKNIIRKYVNGINYSKENIEIALNYYDNDEENQSVVSRRAEHSAACVWVGANAGRRTQAQKAKTAGSENTTVRCHNLVEVEGVEPSSEKGQAPVTTSVASF
jgi:site-specific DNA recombinase